MTSSPQTRVTCGHFLCSLSLVYFRWSVSPGEKLLHTSGTSISSFCQRERPLNCLALIANGACIHESLRTRTNKESFLIRHRSTPCGYTPEPRTGGAAKMPTNQFLSRRNLTTYFPRCCLKIKLQIKWHLGVDCDSPL